MQLTMVYAAGNSLGRAYCIWLIARQLGWDASVYSIGDSWGPLKGTGMPVQKIQDLTEELLSSSDVVIVYQPLPETLLDVLPKANRHGVPVIVDIDDPHWEGRYGFDLLSRIRVVLALMRRGRSPFPPYAARRAARPLQVMTASPFVQDRWPGVLIPHVRPAFPETDMPEGESLRVGFIGSVRPHKGLDLLRSVANEVEGVELFITAPQPDDHRENEHWVGETSLQEGQELLTQVHMSAVLQAPGRWGERQFPVKSVSRPGLMRMLKYDTVKRAIDITGAAVGLVVTAPIQLATAAVVLAAHGRPVLFRQPRPGKDGKLFELVKFRTMRHPDATHMTDEQRLTKVGRVLRATSLDELPELWNVLKGEMSLVGPRPLLVQYLERYTPTQARRHEVRPGVTGLAQVRGRNGLDWDAKLALDVEYLDNRSLALDARILWETIAVVLLRRGISADGHATMSEFQGTTTPGTADRVASEASVSRS